MIRCILVASLALTMTLADKVADLRSVTIRVLDGQDRPLHMATVVVDQADFAKTSVQTNCEGAVYFALMPGPLRIEASFPGCATARLEETIARQPKEPDVEYRIKLSDCNHVLSPSDQVELKADYLESPSSIFSQPDLILVYNTAVREVLIKQSPGDPYVRMIVRPSFKPEWMVEMDKPTGPTATVRLVEADRLIWTGGGTPRRPRTHTFVATVSVGTAERVRAAWLGMLDRTRPVQPGTGGFDGDTYLFSSFVVGRGSLEGEVWSPPPCNLTGDLVDLGSTLRMAATKELSGVDAEARLLKQAERILSGLAGLTSERPNAAPLRQ
jgi:hypothetical protein